MGPQDRSGAEARRGRGRPNKAETFAKLAAADADQAKLNFFKPAAQRQPDPHAAGLVANPAPIGIGKDASRPTTSAGAPGARPAVAGPTSVASGAGAGASAIGEAR